ncbi:MAG: DUF3592 domain-containing protein [Clostridium sp.]|nr:DUF3592 domain-containing protein [Clostridium sp.]MCM1534677.1 DUF3592 domain-containing protein [Clostridium sp.]
MILIKIIFPVFGILFVIIGVVLLVFYKRISQAIRDAREISGKIVDFKEVRYKRQNSGGYHITYAPVYEYYYNGEFQRYTSPVSTSTPAPLGTSVTLYISADGQITEKSEGKLLLVAGIIFASVGAVFVLASVFFIFIWGRIMLP